MVGSQDQPAAEEEGDVEDPRADDEAHDTGQGEAQGDQEHVVLVKVAKEPKQAAPLAEHRKPDHNARYVYHLQAIDGLGGENRGIKSPIKQFKTQPPALPLSCLSEHPPHQHLVW